MLNPLIQACIWLFLYIILLTLMATPLAQLLVLLTTACASLAMAFASAESMMFLQKMIIAFKNIYAAA